MERQLLNWLLRVCKEMMDIIRAKGSVRGAGEGPSMFQGVACCRQAAGQQAHVNGPRCCKIPHADDPSIACRDSNAAQPAKASVYEVPIQ